MSGTRVRQLLTKFQAVLDQLHAALAPVWTAMKGNARRPIDYSWSAAISQAIFLLGSEYIFLLGAPPGVSVACLAVAAVIIAFRATEKTFSRLEQVVWIAIAAIYLPLEIASINTDRGIAARHDEQVHAEERQQFVTLFQRENETYAGQQTAQKMQMKQFHGLVAQGKKSIQNLNSVAASVTQTIGFASGGSSFPVVWSHALVGDDGKERVGFSFQKIGNYPLFDVRVSVGRGYSVPNPTPEIAVMGTTCTISEVNGSWSTPLLEISIGTEAAAYFVAYLEARNGTWEEVLDVRRVSGKLTSREVITRSNFPGGPKTVWDVADQDFPVAHRHDVVFPLMSLTYPNVQEADKTPPDIIRGHFPSNIGGCSANTQRTATTGLIPAPQSSFSKP